MTNLYTNTVPTVEKGRTTTLSIDTTGTSGAARPSAAVDNTIGAPAEPGCELARLDHRFCAYDAPCRRLYCCPSRVPRHMV